MFMHLEVVTAEIMVAATQAHQVLMVVVQGHITQIVVVLE
jgi:hypothetical protein